MNKNNKHKEKRSFLEIVEKESENGLIDVKFLPKNISDSTTETFFAEANRILSASDIVDAEIF